METPSSYKWNEHVVPLFDLIDEPPELVGGMGDIRNTTQTLNVRAEFLLREMAKVA